MYDAAPSGVLPIKVIARDVCLNKPGLIDNRFRLDYD
jgi:hypothetical protein